MQVRNIPISDITPSPLNPRKTFEAEELLELANSIKENGLIQPITIRKTPKGSEHKFEIVCGERRYRACVINEMETIECVVKDLDDKQAFLCMVLENLQRKEVDPLEEGAAIKHLYKEGGYKISQIAKALGKSDSYVRDRVTLTNISDKFAALFRERTLWLIHLQEIAKLDKSQQEILFDACFTPEHISRWPQKILKMEDLAAMIDEHVMNSLDTAKFSLTDPSYTTCGACEGCKLNTATSPARFGNSNKPRCMKRELFLAKNREAVLRQAKKSGMPVVFVGTKEENADILAACETFGIEALPLGNREYVVCPKAPNEEAFTDKEYYAKRLANYQAKKASFDDNIKDGTIMPVFEVAFNGNLSGEQKYLYNTPTDENGNISAQNAYKVKSIDSLKRTLYESMEKEQNDITEAQRVLLQGSTYSADESTLNGKEESIMLAVMLKRMGYQFKKSIGLDLTTSLNMESVLEIALQHKNVILREFIKGALSEESVCYAADLGKLLATLVETTMPEQNAEAAGKIKETYDKKREDLKSSIAKFQSEINNAESNAE